MLGRLGIGMVALLAMGLAACSGVKEELGLAKSSPDEFTVVRKAPLVMPPNFTLRPPVPGTRRNQDLKPTETARAALLNRDGRAVPVDAGDRTGGEVAMLKQAGALGTDDSIRQVIESETSALAARDNSFVDRLIFWQPRLPSGTVVDPTKEAQRLRGNAATGEPVTKGETPVIERRKRGILEGIF
ncbi:MAG: DUF3035 domain-containing protein [Alphaproteobacteria bacterium]